MWWFFWLGNVAAAVLAATFLGDWLQGNPIALRFETVAVILALCFSALVQLTVRWLPNRPLPRFVSLSALVFLSVALAGGVVAMLGSQLEFWQGSLLALNVLFNSSELAVVGFIWALLFTHANYPLSPRRAPRLDKASQPMWNELTRPYEWKETAR